MGSPHVGPSAYISPFGHRGCFVCCLFVFDRMHEKLRQPTFNWLIVMIGQGDYGTRRMLQDLAVGDEDVINNQIQGCIDSTTC